MAKYTLTYSEKAKGWTSFHSFLPDWMVKVNNRFLSIKNGQLYLHNDETNPVRNNFYGEQFDSKMVTVVNEESSEDKIFKTLVLEGNLPWDATIKSNLTESAIKTTEFNARESRYFAYVRRNEQQEDLHGNAAQGIGNILAFNYDGTLLTITYDSIPSLLNVGDRLYQLNGSDQEFLGIVNTIDTENGQVTILDSTPAPLTRIHTSQFNSKFN
jgi:hypothetical protein